jgi:hypothetical protein
MLTIEVAAGGRIIVACDGQRKEHRFRKSSGHKFSEEYAILMELAANPVWKNPPSGSSNHERVRRRFHRLRCTLADLLPIPGDPFERKGNEWRAIFKLRIHKDLTGIADDVATGHDFDDDLPDWHPLAQPYSRLK